MSTRRSDRFKIVSICSQIPESCLPEYCREDLQIYIFICWDMTGRQKRVVYLCSVIWCGVPVNTRHLSDDWSMLGHRLRRWTNNNNIISIGSTGQRCLLCLCLFLAEPPRIRLEGSDLFYTIFHAQNFDFCRRHFFRSPISAVSPWGLNPNIALNMKRCSCHFTKWQIHPFTPSYSGERNIWPSYKLHIRCHLAILYHDYEVWFLVQIIFRLTHPRFPYNKMSLRQNAIPKNGKRWNSKEKFKLLLTRPTPTFRNRYHFIKWIVLYKTQSNAWSDDRYDNWTNFEKKYRILHTTRMQYDRTSIPSENIQFLSYRTYMWCVHDKIQDST